MIWNHFEGVWAEGPVRDAVLRSGNPGERVLSVVLPVVAPKPL